MNSSLLFRVLLPALAVSILIIFFAKPVADFIIHYNLQSSENNLETQVGLVESSEGLWTLYPFSAQTQGQLAPQRENKNLIFNKDRIRLGAKAKLVVQFENGYKLALLENTDVIVEKWSSTETSSPIYLHFIDGQFDLLQSGSKGTLYILKNRQLKTPEEKTTDAPLVLEIQSGLKSSEDQDQKSLEDEKPVIGETLPEAMPEPPSSESTARLPETLTNEYIDQIISQHASQFQKCQANSLRLGRTGKGQALIGLTILPSGRVGEIKILDSNLNDDDMTACISSVFQRIVFQSFSGAEIIRSFPLNFE